MLRKMLSVAVVLAVSGIVIAEEFQCSITKVDGDKVTIQKFKKVEKKEGEKGKFQRPEKDGDPITVTASKDCKFLKVKVDFKSFKDKDAKKADPTPIEGGLTNEMFTKISERGLRARVTVDGSTLSEVVVTDFGGFGKGTKKKKDSN